MDSPQRISISIHQPQSLSPSNSRRRRRSSDSSSPDFEFWMVRNPSFPQPNLLSADQLFSDGVLRPLHLLHLRNPDPDPPAPEPEIPPANVTSPEISPANSEISPASITVAAESGPALSASKRWKDLFKKCEKKASTGEKKQEEQSNNSSGSKLEKERKREKKSQTGGGGSSSAELNINIWPFSRSRSAGNSVTRPKLFPGAPGSRKVSSAPCSRSNSAGESKSRKWPSSPGRPGVHLGRSSPVWQVRRGSGGSSISSSGPKTNHKPYLEPPPSSSSSSASGQKSSSKKEVTETRHSKRTVSSSNNNTNSNGEAAGSRSGRVLNMNVPTCIGYRHHLGCRSNDHSTVGIGVNGGKHGGGGTTGAANDINVGGGNNIFNFRSLFSKKVY